MGRSLYEKHKKNNDALIFKYLKEIRSIILKNIFQNVLNKKVTKKL